VASAATGLEGTVRRMPISEPTTSASTQADKAVATVQPRPATSHS